MNWFSGQGAEARRAARERDTTNADVLVALAKAAYFVEDVPKRYLSIVRYAQPDIMLGSGFSFTPAVSSRSFVAPLNVITLDPRVYGIAGGLRSEGVSHGLTDDGNLLRLSVPYEYDGVVGEDFVQSMRTREVVADPMLVTVLGEVAARARLTTPFLQA